MCYSAQVWDAYQKYQRTFGAKIDFQEFVRLYGIRNDAGSIKALPGMDRSFEAPETPEERQIRSLIDAYELTEKNRLELEVFQQKQRLVEAERKLAVKETKAAAESKRIATDNADLLRNIIHGLGVRQRLQVAASCHALMKRLQLGMGKFFLEAHVAAEDQSHARLSLVDKIGQNAKFFQQFQPEQMGFVHN